MAVDKSGFGAFDGVFGVAVAAENGHVHGRWRGSRNAVNVGVDVWDFRPVRIADIQRRARKLPVNRHWADVERIRE